MYVCMYNFLVSFVPSQFKESAYNAIYLHDITKGKNYIYNGLILSQ